MPSPEEILIGLSAPPSIIKVEWRGQTRNYLLEGIVPSCLWTYDDTTYSWDSACGEKWQFTFGGPKENSVNYCHGCGCKVVIAEDAEPKTQPENPS